MGEEEEHVLEESPTKRMRPLLCAPNSRPFILAAVATAGRPPTSAYGHTAVTSSGASWHPCSQAHCRSHCEGVGCPAYHHSYIDGVSDCCHDPQAWKRRL